jgi:uroporphyrinogen decarboxylase
VHFHRNHAGTRPAVLETSNNARIKDRSMTSREIVTSLLNKEIPERMGLFEHYWGETIPGWQTQGYPEGVAPENHFGYDLRFCSGWLNSEPFPGQSELLEETDEWHVYKDGRGASLKYWKHKSGTPEHMDFECTTPEVWKRFREPLIGVDRTRIGDLEAAKKSLADTRANGHYAVFSNLFVFELMRATLGDQNFLPALLEEPEWIKDFCQVYLDFFRNHLSIVFDEAGAPDGFFVYEDFGYKNGLFCSPATMAELVFPYEKALVSFLKDYGIQVLLHSCGDIRKAIPGIIDAGFDCLQPMEAKAGCNVVEIAREYGTQLSYMGNIDVVALTTNDKKVIEAEIVPKVRAMKEMRIPYFFHSDHSVPPNVTLESYQYALELFRNEWRY